MSPEILAPIRLAVAQATPPGWRTRLTTRGDRWVVLTVQAAPVDLVAVDAVAYPARNPARGYVKVCPTAYEDPWDDASAAVGALWRALHTGNRAEFDGRGERRAGHFVEMWLGTPRKQFQVTL